jgi:hypothetical protein
MSAQIIEEQREAAVKRQIQIAENLAAKAVQERRLRDAVRDIQNDINQWSQAHPKARPKAREAFIQQRASWGSEDYGVEYETLISRLRSNGTSGLPGE